jgi:CRISPR-associated protein Cas5, Tneap subtype
MKILKLKIYQPTAHYRIPFTFARRHTYPIPPYSTVIGLICNVLGIADQKNENFEKIKNGLSLAIYGEYEFLNREYVWLRNLGIESHKSRFSFTENRTINQMPEHPGGQIPTRIDVLENVRLLIYIKHSDEKLLEEMKNALENPKQRIYPIHLGRAEDSVIFEAIDIVELKKKKRASLWENKKL